MTVIAQTDFVGADYNLNHLRTAWRRMAGTVTATTSADGFAAANAGTPRTDTAWRPTGTAPHSWTLTPGAATQISYVGIAVHDLGTQNATVSVQVDTGAGFATVAGATVSPEDDEAILFLIAPVSVDAVRLLISATDAAPTIGVISSGMVTEWPRPAVWTGLPITESERIRFADNQSDTGNWLGRTKTADGLEFKVEVNNLPESFRQGEFKEFRAHTNGEGATFFLALRSADYPDEVAYCWTNSAVRMQRQRPNRRISGSVSIDCRGYRKP